MLDRNDLDRALTALGTLLADREEPFEVVAIGGGALSLIGLIERSTRDIDIVGLHAAGEVITAQPLPDRLQAAVADIAEVLQLDPHWFNSEPSGLLRFGLPVGFVSRCVSRTYAALTVLFASRYDQVHFKLFAAADRAPRGKHHLDLIALAPSREELLQAAAWARTHDPSEGFALVLQGVLEAFGIQDWSDG